MLTLLKKHHEMSGDFIHRNILIAARLESFQRIWKKREQDQCLRAKFGDGDSEVLYKFEYSSPPEWKQESASFKCHHFTP